ncbi:DUF1697 domain-containing protein [Methanocella sp. MCL-LM]|uniref:DUF1697 domain-containing protein n=1 Tax=Methanocella sp. MCL-LM TaxID=3412035 RepID=UPI003C7535EE
MEVWNGSGEWSAQKQAGTGTGYVAFLRGINVGGNSVIRMADLGKAFESMGFRHVKTILASGNVLFEVPEENTQALSEKITQKLGETFGWEILVIVRTIDELRELEAQQPFEGVVVTPQTRLIVMFLSKNLVQPTIPDLPAHEDLRIVGIYNRAICSVIDEENGTATVQLMSALEKEFGKQVTTRTWGTVLKVLKAGNAKK